MISKLGRGSRLALAVGLMLAFLAGSAASQQPPRQPPPGPRPGQPPGPPPGGGHPWNNDLMMRLGSDRDGFGAETVFVERAGVPSVTRMRDGRWLATFQWFPEDDRAAFDRVAVAFGDEEGKNWSKPRKVVFEGLPPQYMRPFDPTLVTLDDGRVRMYFTSTPNPRRPGDRDTTAIYSAISTDGIHYEFESGARFAVEGKRVIDCAVLRLGQTWHMIAPIGRPEDGAYHAESADGLEFTRRDDIPSRPGVNWTGNLVAHGEGMRFYGSSMRGVWWVYSKDGRQWAAPSFLGFHGGDPTVASLGDRQLLIYVSLPRRGQ